MISSQFIHFLSLQVQEGPRPHSTTRLVDLAGGEGGPVPPAVVLAPYPVGHEGAGTGGGR